MIVDVIRSDDFLNEETLPSIVYVVSNVPIWEEPEDKTYEFEESFVI
jgi:hypothetical protein